MRFGRPVATVVLALGAMSAWGQRTAPTVNANQSTPSWMPVAGYALNRGLAGPASGPVQSVWYSADGRRLLAQTASGRVFETTDFQQWKLNSNEAVPTQLSKPAAGVRPEAGQLTLTTSSRRYSVTQENIYGTDDGRSWINLTGFNGRSIIGDGFSALVVSPSNPLDIAASNLFGVWRSLDGGLSWQGLNENLPNLAAHGLPGQRTVVLADGTLASATGGKWTSVEGVAPDIQLRAALATRNGFSTLAAAQSASTIYVATTRGRVSVSVDDGSTWADSVVGSVDAISRIWIDPANTQAALAAAGARLYRTTNGGRFWDEITGSFTGGAIHGLAADSAAGVVYLAAEHGIYSGRVALNAADAVPARWTPISGDLPIAVAWDARLNSDGTLTVLLDGYGVYETAAPHRAQAPRIVNGADMSDRAAAPGSLISVLGANVRQARSGQLSYKILLATDQSSQLQVPFEVSPGALQLAIESDSGVWTAPLNVKQAAPAIFVDAEGTPIIQDAASGFVIDAGTALRAGSAIQVLATGLGQVTPAWPTGVPAPVDSPPAVVAPVTAYLDGTPIKVTRATLAPTFIGNYLVELQIPLIVNRGVSELRIVVNGEESNRVKLYLESNVSGK